MTEREVEQFEIPTGRPLNYEVCSRCQFSAAQLSQRSRRAGTEYNVGINNPGEAVVKHHGRQAVHWPA
jgi:hypothetical protein